MSHKFTFDADLRDPIPTESSPHRLWAVNQPRGPAQTRLTVHIRVECHDSDGCDAMYEIECIELPGGDFIEESELTDGDRSRLDRACQAIADEHGPEAYNEFMRDAADAAYDRMRDGD